MNKLFILAILAIISFNVYFADASCQDYQCADGWNSPCNTDMYRSSVALQDAVLPLPDDASIICPVEFYCGANPSFINGQSNPNLISPRVCLPLGKGGDPCSIYQTSCVIGLECYAPSIPLDMASMPTDSPSTCQAMAYAGFGEDCNSDYQCAQGLQCQWDQKKCYPEFDDDFEGDCQYSAQCASNHYCNGSSWCVPKVAINGDCSNEETCVDNALCTPMNGGIYTCLEVFTRTIGETCASGQYSSFSVIQGCTDSYCLSSVCTALPTATPASVNCTSDGCDTGGESCFCELGSSKGTCLSQAPADFNGCEDNSKAFYQCVVDNECSLSANYLAPFSCVYHNCKEEACAMYGSCNNELPSNNCFTEDQTFFDIGYCSGGDLGANSANLVYPSVTLLLVVIAFILL